MNKIILLIGPPCSGKSTWAKKYISENQDTVRINRDSLREMFKGKYKFDKTIESLTTRVSVSIIKAAGAVNKNIVLDNTHCKNSYIIEMMNQFPGYKFTLKFFVEPLWKLKFRNIVRYIKTGVWIPPTVIENMEKNCNFMIENFHKDMADYLHMIEKVER